MIIRRRGILCALGPGTALATAGCLGDSDDGGREDERGNDDGNEDESADPSASDADDAGEPDGEVDEITIEHSAGAARAGADGVAASVIRIRVEHVVLEPGRAFRIVDGQGQSVTVAPEADDPIDVSGSVSFRLYRGRSPVDEPHLSVAGEDVPVDVTGDTSMFRSDPVFSGYTVELVDGDEVIESTDERVYGIGYPEDLTQEGTTGEIAVSFPAIDEVADSWTVVFEVINYEADGTPDTQVSTSMDRDGDRFVTSFDSGTIDPLPEDGFRDFDVSFYVDGDPTTGGPNLWAGGDVQIDGLDD